MTSFSKTYRRAVIKRMGIEVGQLYQRSKTAGRFNAPEPEVFTVKLTPNMKSNFSNTSFRMEGEEIFMVTGSEYLTWQDLEVIFPERASVTPPPRDGWIQIFILTGTRKGFIWEPAPENGKANYDRVRRSFLSEFKKVGNQ